MNTTTQHTFFENQSQKEQEAAALRYDKEKDNAPKVVAKGNRYLAETIIDIAKKYEIPIKKDEDMMEMLEQIEVNREIPVEMYKAVAEIFSFIYNLANEKQVNK